MLDQFKTNYMSYSGTVKLNDVSLIVWDLLHRGMSHTDKLVTVGSIDCCF